MGCIIIKTEEYKKLNNKVLELEQQLENEKENNTIYLEFTTELNGLHLTYGGVSEGYPLRILHNTSLITHPKGISLSYRISKQIRDIANEYQKIWIKDINKGILNYVVEILTLSRKEKKLFERCVHKQFEN